ncbi:MAG: M20/M25/M40 family metallo-hydrolase [Niabella sp.]
MLRKQLLSVIIFSFLYVGTWAQNNAIINQLVNDARQNSILQTLSTELMDRIGPRLVGSPQMQKAHDWVIEKYTSWQIPTENQQWGTWRGWERGISHIDMLYPRVHSLSGQQLAWSPQTPVNGITAAVVMIPFAKDSLQFQQTIKSVKGKLVMISMPQPTGRTDANWAKYATPTTLEKMKTDREQLTAEWQKQMDATGYNFKTIQAVLENAGAVGLISSYWSKEYGSDKIFGANTKKIPVVDVSLEDYGLLYRLVRDGQQPKVRIIAHSKETGIQPTFNTIATIKGKEKPNEYVVLSAHLDSWDGGTGATDNGTGTVVMMEAMRLLKKWYPNPKRTIIAGHWGSEEQGLNGSRAFVEDHPDIVRNIQAVFNQDGGTGRLNFINGAGFLHGYDFLKRWVKAIPKEIGSNIQLAFPGMPAGGGSDNASFIAAGIPSYYLGTENWDYTNLTWHTNLDTYDKIVFDDLTSSMIATAILAYMACEEPELVSREPIKLPDNNTWPTPQKPTRRGGL